jgi:8-oxo-dGTP pyrophosphatase MutT (NUDIX family)
MGLILDFVQRLDQILAEEFSEDYFAAVGIVQCGDRWLLGLARNTGDDRTGRWVFPGGHVKHGEDTAKAAVREVWEETGIRCKAIGKPFSLPSKKGVAFVHCRAAKGQDFENNQEFSSLGWFSTKDMRSLKLYGNVLKLIDRVRR